MRRALGFLALVIIAIALWKGPSDDQRQPAPSSSIAPRAPEPAAFAKFDGVAPEEVLAAGHDLDREWEKKLAAGKLLGWPPNDLVALRMAITRLTTKAPYEEEAKALEKRINSHASRALDAQAKAAAKQAAAEKKALEDDAAGREAFADQLDLAYLKDGMDVRITLSGAKKTTIKLTYVLMSRPLVYKITNETAFLESCWSRGFKTVVFSDGYDYSWTYKAPR